MTDVDRDREARMWRQAGSLDSSPHLGVASVAWEMVTTDDDA